VYSISCPPIFSECWYEDSFLREWAAYFFFGLSKALSPQAGCAGGLLGNTQHYPQKSSSAGGAQ